MSLFTDATVVFPNNAVALVAARLQALYSPDLLVVKRPLRTTDNTQSVGVYPGAWYPDETTYEMPSNEPTVQRYTIQVQCFAKDMDRERAIAVHSVMSKVIRSLLYNDAPLKLGLDVLSVTMDGAIEHIQRRGMTRQQYISNEIDGIFHCLSTLEWYIETETK
jgi:hypothetical protein